MGDNFYIPDTRIAAVIIISNKSPKPDTHITLNAGALALGIILSLYVYYALICKS